MTYPVAENYMDDLEAYQNDMDKLEQEALRIIEKARITPITDDEAALLRWAAGVGN